MPLLQQNESVFETQDGSIPQQVRAAAAAFPAWSRRPVDERRLYVRQLRHAVVRQQEALACSIAAETGKPVVEVLSQEVTATLETLRYLERHVARWLREQRFRYWRPGFWTKAGAVYHEPLGVLALIGPANFPFSLMVMQAGQALLCGNCIVVKASERCPDTTRWIGDLLAMTDLPAGVAQVVAGGSDAAQALIAHDDIAKVFFTGSYATGREVAAQCGRHFKPCVLELGGNSCALVDADADLRLAANGIVWSAFCAAGRSCVGTRLVYVHADVVDRLVESMVQAIEALDDRDLAALPPAAPVEPEAADRFVEAAIAQGAMLHVRRKKSRGSGFVPAMLHVSGTVTEPVPSPVLVVQAVASMHQAVRAANVSAYGLSASIWSRNGRQARRLAQQLRKGIVWINDAGAGQPQFPWGGSKRSGWGRVLSSNALYEMTHTKVVSHDRRHTARSKIWWFPYVPEKVPLFKAANRFMYADRRGRALGDLLAAGLRYGIARARASLSKHGHDLS